MPRSFVVYGETMVRVKGRIGTPIGNVTTELGLSTDAIRIIPRIIHQDIKVDDFGPEVPADVMRMMADCQIRMNLVHYDESVLRFCIMESFGPTVVGVLDGTCGPAGRSIGRGAALNSPTNSYISINLIPMHRLGVPWRFPACYINAQPLEIPIGAEKTVVSLTWRAIPYQVPNSLYNGEVISNNAVLWDHTYDS